MQTTMDQSMIFNLSYFSFFFVRLFMLFLLYHCIYGNHLYCVFFGFYLIHNSMKQNQWGETFSLFIIILCFNWFIFTMFHYYFIILILSWNTFSLLYKKTPNCLTSHCFITSNGLMWCMFSLCFIIFHGI